MPLTKLRSPPSASRLKPEAALDTELVERDLLGGPLGLSDALRQLTMAPHFRSATVDELELDEDFFRRPARPEDLSFLDFATPVTEATLGLLSSLASQRILLTLYESEECVLPRPGINGESWAAWRGFYDETALRNGAAVLAPLRRHALGFLDVPGVEGTIADLCCEAHESATNFWTNIRQSLENADYFEEGLRFLLVQSAPLWESVRRTPPAVPAQVARLFESPPFNTVSDALAAAARALRLRIGRHSYWQFYLPASLAIVNLLHSLARSPATWFDYAGARLAAEADRAAFAGVLVPTQLPQGQAPLSQVAVSAIAGSADLAGLRQMASGASRMLALLRAARRELAAQILWISDLSWAEQAAHEIDARIAQTGAAIDRETFVEPREMCSTTHVHDDHRLVVIESGTMVFWGNLGMCHKMEPGDMILVPMGRLHGSSVLSRSCTYHQPVIPDSWRSAIPAWRQVPT